MGSSFCLADITWGIIDPHRKETMTPVKPGYRREYFGNGIYIDWKIR